MILDVLLAALGFAAATVGAMSTVNRTLRVAVIFVAVISFGGTTYKSYSDEQDKNLLKYALISNLKLTERNKNLLWQSVVSNFSTDQKYDIDYASMDNGMLFFNTRRDRPFAIALSSDQLAPIAAKIFAKDSFDDNLKQITSGSFPEGFDEEKYLSYLIVAQGVYESYYSSTAQNVRYDDRVGLTMRVGDNNQRFVLTKDEIENTAQGQKYEALGRFAILVKDKLERELGVP